MAVRRVGVKLPRMYTDLAPLYDAVYSAKGYAREARLLRREIETRGRSRGKELLDVGCGTGHHIEYLRRWFQCTGLDASPEMLKVARKRLPGIPLVRGRMESFDLGHQFDAVICMFGALGYTRTLAGMRKAIRCMADHVKPGGVLIIQPWLEPQVWKVGRLAIRTVEAPGQIITRVTSPLPAGRRTSRFEMQYLIARSRRPIQHAVEIHELGLFRRADIQAAIRREGLRARYIPVWHGDGRGLHVGVRVRR